MIEASVACQLLHQISSIVLKFALFDCINAIVAELEHFCETAYLRRGVDNVQTILICQSLLEQAVQCHSHYFFKRSKPVFDFSIDHHWLA